MKRRDATSTLPSERSTVLVGLKKLTKLVNWRLTNLKAQVGFLQNTHFKLCFEVFKNKLTFAHFFLTVY
jgi:hypothetical protein